MKNKIAVLIIDDNKSFTDRIVAMLEEMNTIKSIEVAEDFESGCKLFIDQKPDMVLLDINLPGKNGIELLKVIKQSKWICEVVMITNHSDDIYRQLCHDLGAGHFLDKTHDFDQVPFIINQRVLN